MTAQAITGGVFEEAARLLGPKARRNWPIGPLTTYRVGGSASVFSEMSDESDIRRAREAVMVTQLPVLVLGKGSNVIVGDKGFPGIVLTLGEGFAGIEVDGTRVRAGAAASLPVLARRTAAAGLTGLEWAVGVPGSVGGAVRMNAGGHGSETRNVLTRYRFVDLKEGEEGEATAERLSYSYRNSSIEAHQVVLWAEFALAFGDRDEAEAQIAEIVRWRRENQPGGQNAGSVFTNPPGDSAGRLVDQAGLKGYRIGTASVSMKHANFIQADAGGSADDVIALVREVRRLVAERLGVHLEFEVKIVGDGVGTPA